MILKHTEANCHTNRNAKYVDEIDYLVSSSSRNNFIRRLALKLEGNTLCLFQLVEKHGKNLHEMIEEKADINRRVFFIYGGVEADEREKIRAITEKETNAIIVASYGTFQLALTFVIYTILFLLVLVSLG